ncbi:hypothetical protein SETIT_5G228300v2 [Setaria italica]|uniref:NADP-dependent oxidoreductase domain-containing protein n=1 Tax=Setaria italica TaxID=4555 RepID=K3XSJ5_SETIT|nr:hypothetical protein SETIT_5G228300v2 [Setaria italica]
MAVVTGSEAAAGQPEQVQVATKFGRTGRVRLRAAGVRVDTTILIEGTRSDHRCSPAQVALAWVLHQGDYLVPVPGTTKIEKQDANIDSFKVKLTHEAFNDFEEITRQIREEDVTGDRQNTLFAHTNWNYADTTRK